MKTPLEKYAITVEYAKTKPRGTDPHLPFVANALAKIADYALQLESLVGLYNALVQHETFWNGWLSIRRAASHDPMMKIDDELLAAKDLGDAMIKIAEAAHPII